MPHDRNGFVVIDGDIVNVRAKITNISPGEKDCNCTFTVVIPPGVDETYAPTFAGNTGLGTAERVEVRDAAAPHPATAAILKFFTFSHLPEKLQAVSKPFSELAYKIADGPSNAETTVALRKLLESKDAAVRAMLP